MKPIAPTSEITMGTLSQLGIGVSHARRRAGLTQRELAERIGVPLWKMERLERGQDDCQKYLAAIASATGGARLQEILAIDRSDYEMRSDHLVLEPTLSRRSLWKPHREAGQWVVLGSLTVLVVIRFFTEKVHFLPKAATFIDIPLFLLLITAASLRTRGRGAEERHVSFLVPATLFFAVAVISVLTNLGRVAPAPVVVFLYGFLAPLGVYCAVYRLWPPGRALSLSRLLVALGVVQLVVFAAFDLRRFIASGHNPDLISGTFGDNAYQLVFFLLVLTALLAGMMMFERHRLIAKLAPGLFVAIATVIFLAQYRALLATTLFSILLTGLLLSKVRGWGVLMASFLLVIFIGSLSYVASRFPRTKFEQTIAAVKADPSFFAATRLSVAGDVVKLYSDNPRYIITGTGPGSFSSRAWKTFADTAEGRTAVAAPYAQKVNGGTYHTDVSDKYVIPRLRNVPLVQGSHALNSPYSSYLALLAEVGILGFLLLVGIYLAATVAAGRLALQAMRARQPRDPLPALLLACTIAFAVLLQLAALENWLEVTRITFPSWALLAVGAKELDARRGAAAQ